MNNNTVIIANITYNPTGWRNTYINPHAGHSYARNHPGHESLNFKFDKKKLDTNKFVHGFVQWTRPPAKYKDGGIILFYTRNLKNNYSEIVGIYCDAYIIQNPIITPYEGFQNDNLVSNIKGNIDLSLLFPIPLKASKYSHDRLVGQVGYKYSDMEFAEKVITDEIKELQKSGMQANEYLKLNEIYKFITGKYYLTEKDEIDNELEQDEIIEILKSDSIDKIIKDLQNVQPTEPEQIEIKQKLYKRDNKTIAQLKIIRKFKCQICGYKLQKKNGGFYIEAAHIIPKSKKGNELPENILILCPNHHKEFDLGQRDIIKHDKNIIEFILNGKSYKIELNIENTKTVTNAE